MEQYIAYCIILHGVQTSTCNHSICYQIDASQYLNDYINLILYLIFTAIPFFISSKKNIHVFGILLLISCAITYLFWNLAFYIYMVFFAAILSCYN